MIKRILVIDGESRSVSGTVAGLKLRGVKVDTVKTKQDAEAYLLKNVYDAVLLELMIPEKEAKDIKADRPELKHGLAILNAIRNGKYQVGGTVKEVKVVVITCVGHEDPEVMRVLNNLGASVLVKPVFPASLAPIMLDWFK